MTNWTQGPWEADQCGVSANGEDVCDCGERAQWSGDSFHPFKNAEANARLIAAAPELYEALRHMLDGRAGCRDLARSALSKARGEA